MKNETHILNLFYLEDKGDKIEYNKKSITLQMFY